MSQKWTQALHFVKKIQPSKNSEWTQWTRQRDDGTIAKSHWLPETYCPVARTFHGSSVRGCWSDTLTSPGLTSFTSFHIDSHRAIGGVVVVFVENMKNLKHATWRNRSIFSDQSDWIIEFHPEMAPKNPEGHRNAADAAVCHWSAFIPTAPNGTLPRVTSNWTGFPLRSFCDSSEENRAFLQAARLHSYSGVYDVKGQLEIGWNWLENAPISYLFMYPSIYQPIYCIWL
jgi:hypothetical protein